MASSSFVFNPTFIKILFFVILLIIGATVHYLAYYPTPSPCHNQIEKFCEGKSLWNAYECLRKVDRTKLTEECNTHMKIHRSCRNDIHKHCKGQELSGEVEGCLTRVKNLTMTCKVEMNPPWKKNAHLNKYNQRRVQERKEYEERKAQKKYEDANADHEL